MRPPSSKIIRSKPTVTYCTPDHPQKYSYNKQNKTIKIKKRSQEYTK